MYKYHKITLFCLFILSVLKLEAQGIQTFQGVRFYHPTTQGQYISLLPPNAITTYGLTLPAVQGGSGQVLVNDGTGLLSWATPNINFWSLTGNTLTVDGTNFIGTIDNIPLSFRVNNEKAGRVDAVNANAFFGHQAGNTNTTGTSNVFIGKEAGYLSNTDLNTFVGHNAGRNTTSGIRNTALGCFALTNNSTGTYNVAIGSSALTINGSGSYNVAIGHNAGGTSADGQNSVFLGRNAGAVAGALTNATALGYNAKVSTSNTLILGGTGADVVNVGIGLQTAAHKLDVRDGNIALTNAGTAGEMRFFEPSASGSNYTAFKAQTQAADLTYTLPAADGTNGQMLATNGSGLLDWRTVATNYWSITGNGSLTDATNFIGTTDNVPFNIRVNGQKSGRIPTDGAINAFGYQAAFNNTSTIGTTCFGHRAGYAGSGNDNTYFGYSTGFASTTASNSAFFGSNAGAANAGGANNTFIGYRAGATNTGGGLNTFVGANAGAANASGIQNTYMGYEAGLANLTGSSNTFIGYQADATSGGLSNATAIGYKAKATTSSTLILGGTGADLVNVGIGTTTPTERLHVAGNIYATGTITSSDVRFKTNISTISNALEKVLQMRGVNYEMRVKEFPSRGFSEGKQIGFIAQEIEQFFPEVVSTQSDGYKAVDYSKVSAILVEVVKEQQSQIEKLKMANNSASNDLENIKNDLSKLNAENQKLKEKTNEIEELKAEIASIKALLKGVSAKQENSDEADKK